VPACLRSGHRVHRSAKEPFSPGAAASGAPVEPLATHWPLPAGSARGSWTSTP